jgi:hypothetical protein
VRRIVALVVSALVVSACASRDHLAAKSASGTPEAIDGKASEPAREEAIRDNLAAGGQAVSADAFRNPPNTQQGNARQSLPAAPARKSNNKVDLDGVAEQAPSPKPSEQQANLPTDKRELPRAPSGNVSALEPTNAALPQNQNQNRGRVVSLSAALQIKAAKLERKLLEDDRSTEEHGRCDRACDALRSMARTTDDLCALTAPDDQRCTQAVARLDQARTRVRRNCPACRES